MKAEPSQLTPRNLTENLKLLIDQLFFRNLWFVFDDQWMLSFSACKKNTALLTDDVRWLGVQKIAKGLLLGHYSIYTKILRNLRTKTGVIVEKKNVHRKSKYSGSLATMRTYALCREILSLLPCFILRS